ncbi:MAG TPA: DUF2339 domain-containing protein [Hanamia sp.]
MQEIIIFLLIIILVILVKFKNFVTERFNEIDRDLQQLKKTYSSATTESPKATVTEVITPAPKKAEKDYWESSFKRMDEPVIIPAIETSIDEKTTIEPGKKVAEQAATIGVKSINSVPPVTKKKPTFFERNPDLEKFIGENLVSKIGIAILVLAIGFFVKFAIDNNWIGPVGRVSIGILCGGILVGLAHRLRHNYKAFSSVLAGGGLAIFYFTITLAYHQFNLFSQTTAFVIMVVITIFAVALSILYNRQELAVIALVGGFAAPFLVSNGSGNYKVLFTYLLILNTGLLVIAYNKAWRLLNALAFIFTAILFTGWLISLNYDTPANTYSNGLMFATAFYLLFFIINIANNIKENKKFIVADFSILLINTALYFAAGLYCIEQMNKPEYRGLFTILIGVLNLVVSYFLFRKKKVDTNILYLFIGITLTFISLTAPIQLHGNYITLFWASEAVLLFWLFKKSKINIIQYASAFVWIAMLVSLLMDWQKLYSNTNAVSIIFNKGFITGLYCAVASYILFMLKTRDSTGDTKPASEFIPKNVFRMAGILLLFFTGAIEIVYQFSYFFPKYTISILYLQLYYLVFVLMLLFINDKLMAVKLSINAQLILLLSCVLFYLFALGAITDLQRQLLLSNQYSGYFNACWINAVLMAIVLYKITRIESAKTSVELLNKELTVWLTCAVVVTFLSMETFWIANNIFYSSQNSLETIQKVFIKTGLPILWGLCSFGFMWLGMQYKFKPLRIISLVLFLVTLLKLFIFDLRGIPVGGKIAAFFCLGVLLLIVSFMYQRLKKIIIQNEEDKPL